MSDKIRLVVLDMEGTLTANPTVWEIMHRKLGTWESHGKPYWEQFKAGRFDYDEFARKDVLTWQGAPFSLLEEAVNQVPIMTGCAELLSALSARDVQLAIVSNGLERLGRRLAGAFPIARVQANRAVIADGHLTGKIEIRVPFTQKGLAFLHLAQEMNVPSAQVVAVGDGPADIPMFRCAGRSIAFRPENDRVAEAADFLVTEPDLRHLIPILDKLMD